MCRMKQGHKKITDVSSGLLKIYKKICMTLSKASALAAPLRSIHSCDQLEKAQWIIFVYITSWNVTFDTIVYSCCVCYIAAVQETHISTPFSHDHQIGIAICVFTAPLEAKKCVRWRKTRHRIEQKLQIPRPRNGRQAWNVASQTLQMQQWSTTLMSTFKTSAPIAEYSHTRNTHLLPPFPKSKHLT